MSYDEALSKQKDLESSLEKEGKEFKFLVIDKTVDKAENLKIKTYISYIYDNKTKKAVKIDDVFNYKLYFVQNPKTVIRHGDFNIYKTDNSVKISVTGKDIFEGKAKTYVLDITLDDLK